jgi:hypothetical protein
MSSGDDLLWTTKEWMPNGLVIQQVWPTSAGYAWRSILLNRWRAVSQRRGSAAGSRQAAEDLADGAAIWLGNHKMAFVLLPEG